MPNELWTSNRLDVTEYKCLDVQADSTSVLLRQVDGVSVTSIKLTPSQDRAVAQRLLDGADHSDSTPAGGQ